MGKRCNRKAGVILPFSAGSPFLVAAFPIFECRPAHFWDEHNPQVDSHKKRKGKMKINRILKNYVADERSRRNNGPFLSECREERVDDNKTKWTLPTCP